MSSLFSKNLKIELIYHGYTLKDFSKMIGISYNTMLSYMNKSGYMPRADLAVKMAKCLNTSVEYLITGKEPNKEEVFKHYPTSEELLILDPKIQKVISELIHSLSDIKKKELYDE